MSAKLLKKSMLGAAAAAMALGVMVPAHAGGGRHHYDHGRHVTVHHGWSHGHYKPRRHYYHGHHGKYRHRGGLSGGEAAVIAAAIIGGAILIDAASDRDRHDDRYDYPPPRRSYAPAPRDDYYYRRDDRAPPPASDYGYEDDGELLGGEGIPAGASYNYGAAYNDCKAETRAAADQGGLYIALPAKPERITPIDGGAAVRFTADFIARDGRGEYRKTMVCEADLDGVRFLELV